MISVCCCTMNARWDIEIFIRSLELHNQDYEFEIVVTHDNRSDDMTKETLKELAVEYGNIKIVTHTEQDTLDYFDIALNYYCQNNLFSSRIREHLKNNFEQHKRGELVDPTKGFLWQSSGVLYNKAVEAASGDIFLVVPGDFMFLFSLNDLEKYIRSHSGFRYASPSAIWARINTSDLNLLRKHVASPDDFKRTLIRNYLKCPPWLSDLHLPDYYKERILSLNDPCFTEKVKSFVETAALQGRATRTHIKEVPVNPAYHGFHVMTRGTYKQIGGFTEQWVHRAYSDDRMTVAGNRLGPGNLPPRFAVAICGQYQLPGTCKKSSPLIKEQLFKIDPKADKHPIPQNVQVRYLYKGLLNDTQMAIQVIETFKDFGPIRLIT